MYDELAEQLRDENVDFVEVSRYIKNSNGDVYRETIAIDYFSDGDYQWSTSVKPIYVE